MWSSMHRYSMEIVVLLQVQTKTGAPYLVCLLYVGGKQKSKFHIL